MLKICLVVWKSKPQYAYKHYVIRQERERETDTNQ